jgi:hypothetical protein
MDLPDAPTKAPEVAPQLKSEVSELATMIKQLIERDRNPASVLVDDELPRRIAPKREPWVPPRIAAAITQSLGLWPLYVINAILLWAVLVLFKEAPSFEYVERVSRILQLATIALLFDIWLHPMQHPDSLEGPAQGARQYQRIYLIATIVLAGCIAL